MRNCGVFFAKIWRSDHQSYFKMPFIYAIKLFFCINELTLFLHHVLYTACGNSSVGRAQPCQGWGREFESRFPLQILKSQSKLSFCCIPAYILSKIALNTYLRCNYLLFKNSYTIRQYQNYQQCKNDNNAQKTEFVQRVTDLPVHYAANSSIINALILTRLH